MASLGVIGVVPIANCQLNKLWKGSILQNTLKNKFNFLKIWVFKKLNLVKGL